MIKVKPFDCDRITLGNWEGFVPVRKRVVHACQMHFPEGFRVTTPQGVITGKPGDYLVINLDGEKRVIRREAFEANYVEVKHDIARVQAVYDDEINFSISCFWDAGFDVALGDEANGFKGKVFVDTFREALKALVELADRYYPKRMGGDNVQLP